MSAPSGHAAALESEAHLAARELLPWLANGTLAGAERTRVQAHLDTCAVCRAELATLHALRDVADIPVQGLDLDAALGRLLPQLDVATAAPGVTLPPAQGWRARLAANDARWLRVAAGLQFGVIAVLAGLLAHPAADSDPRPDAFRVLGADGGRGSALIVTFKPDTPEYELRRIVATSGARIADGPTVTGAWVLRTGEAPAEVAQRLRRQPAVTLAEPLGTAEQP